MSQMKNNVNYLKNDSTMSSLKLGYESRAAGRKLLFKAFNFQKRMQSAIEIVDRSLQFWEESSFAQFSNSTPVTYKQETVKTKNLFKAKIEENISFTMT